MPASVRHLTPVDLPLAEQLLAATVGGGFARLDEVDVHCSFVAVDHAEVAGVLIADLAAAGAVLPEGVSGGQVWDAIAGGAESGRLPQTPKLGRETRVLRIRELAVADEHRRRGIATRLLRRAEEAGRAGAAALAVVYAWLPAGQARPATVSLYEAAGYRALVELPGFYAALSEDRDATCPFCGPPPCRCAARVYVKTLPAGG